MATTILDDGTMHFEVDDLILFFHREGRVGISLKKPLMFGFRIHDSYEFSISLGDVQISESLLKQGFSI